MRGLLILIVPDACVLRGWCKLSAVDIGSAVARYLYVVDALARELRDSPLTSLVRSVVERSYIAIPTPSRKLGEAIEIARGVAKSAGLDPSAVDGAKLRAVLLNLGYLEKVSVASTSLAAREVEELARLLEA